MKLGMILYIGNLHISKQILKRINVLIKDIISFIIFSQLFKRRASTNKRNKSEDSRRLG